MISPFERTRELSRNSQHQTLIPRIGISAVLALLLVLGVPANQDITFEVWDFNSLQDPPFSISTRRVTVQSTDAQFSGDANSSLNPIDGTLGTQCYDTTLSFNTDSGWPSDYGALVRISDFPDRHLLSEPAPTSGIGIYVKYDGSAGDIEISLTIREDPIDTDDNETYESTPWRRLSGSDGWQYFHWTFSEITFDADNWGANSSYGSEGDGVYDGGGVGDETSLECILLRPIQGSTVPNTTFNIRFDDIHTGARHTPVSSSLPHPLDLGDVGSTVSGVRIEGVNPGDWTGAVTRGVGDFNGDGLEDIAVGSPRRDFQTREDAGAISVIWGSRGPLGTNGVLNLGDLDGTAGFTMFGDASSSQVGGAFGSGGDVDGDGRCDVLFPSAPNEGDPITDLQNLIWGNPDALGEGGVFDLGLRSPAEGLAWEVSVAGGVGGAGDTNADGHPDILFSRFSDPSGDFWDMGETFLINGSDRASLASVELDTLDGTDGVRIVSGDSGDLFGAPVTGLGDVNGDGYDDFAISAINTGHSLSNPDLPLDGVGAVHILFGSEDGLGTDGYLDLRHLSLNDRVVTVRGMGPMDLTGHSIASAGDVDGDGRNEVLIGSPIKGEAYVLRGTDSLPLNRFIDLQYPPPNGLATLRGELDSGYVGGAGDFNGDGFCEILVGAINARAPDSTSDSREGRAYLVFGGENALLWGEVFSLGDLNGDNGFLMHGAAPNDYAGVSPSCAGDLNGDGLSDITLGVLNPHGDRTGQAYVINGRGMSGTAVYRAFQHPGMVPLQGIGRLGDGSHSIPFSRCWIGFDGGSGPGFAGTSLQTVTLTRSAAQISNLSRGSGDDVARVMWCVESNRVGHSVLSMRLRYLDREIAGLDEGRLRLFMASSPSGPWTMVGSQAARPERNEFDITLGEPWAWPLHFAIAEERLEPSDPPEIVDLQRPFGSEGRPLMRICGEQLSQHLGNGGHGGIAFGDLNGDGFDDMIIGAANTFAPTGRTGVAYVICGGESLPDQIVDLAQPQGTHGESRIWGEKVGDYLGWAVISGDFDGDGFDDAALSATGANVDGILDAGEVFIVFGHAGIASSQIDLQSPPQGVRTTAVHGENENAGLGSSMAVGDLNGDGLDDLVMGAAGRSGSSNYPTLGGAYILFGRPDLAGQSIDLSEIPESSGVIRILGDDIGDLFGYAAACGDFNGDGLDDVVISSYEADGPTNEVVDDRAGEVTVIWGGGDLTPQTIDLDTDGVITPAGETRIFGTTGFRYVGFSVGAGDIDADGFDDIVIGAIAEAPAGRSIAGMAYVIWGDPSLPGQSLELNTGVEPGPLGETRILGDLPETRAGWSVAAGDVNGDGFDDVVVTAPGRSPYPTEIGKVHVIYGGANLRGRSLDLRYSADDVRVLGVSPESFLGTAGEAGADFNRDGFSEFAAAAWNGDNPSLSSSDNQAGWAVMVAGAGSAETATAIERFRPGAAPLRGIGGRFSPAMRLELAFDAGDNGAGGASEAMVTLTRSQASLENLATPTDAHWEISTDRTGYDTVTLNLQYLTAEMDGLEETDLRLFRAPSQSGPWTLLPRQALHPLRNEIIAQAEDVGVFAIADTGLGGDLFETDSLENPVPLSPGVPLVRSISPVCDQDWMTFDLQEPATVTLAALGAGAEVDLTLWDITTALPGSLIAQGNGFDALIPPKLLPAGSYLVRVEDVGGDQVIHECVISLLTDIQTDPYEEDDSPSQAKSIASGEVQARSVAPVGDPDWVVVNLENPADLTAHLSGAASDLVLYLIRFGSEGQEIIGFETGQSATVSANLPSGEYFLMVEDWFNDEEIPLYELSLAINPPTGDAYEIDNSPLSAKPILPGEVQTSRSIRPLGDRDWATFTLTESAEVTASATGAASEMVLYLRRFDDSNWAYPDDLDFDVALSPEVSANLTPGQYYLMAEDWFSDEEVADYTLSLQVRPFTGDAYEPDNTPLTAKPIFPGEIQMARSIIPLGDHDWARLDLDQAGIVVAEIQGATSEMVLYLFGGNPAGSDLLHFDVGLMPSVSAHLPSGTYHLMAEEWGGDQTISDYSLGVSFMPEALPTLSADVIVEYLLGTRVWNPELDVNGDGTLDAADIVSLTGAP